MRTIGTYGTFEQAVEKAPPTVQETARRLRALIVDIYPDVCEVPWPHQGNIGYGIGPKKNSEHFCYIMTTKDRVNLGFFHGVDIPDPGGRLEGTGKRLRHVKVRASSMVDETWLRAMLVAALEERRASTAP